MSGGLEKSLFNLKVTALDTPLFVLAHNLEQKVNWLPYLPQKFTSKQLSRQAAKAGKDEIAEKNKLKKVLLNPTPPPSFSSFQEKKKKTMRSHTTYFYIYRPYNKITRTSPRSMRRTPSANRMKNSTCWDWDPALMLLLVEFRLQSQWGKSPEAWPG